MYYSLKLGGGHAPRQQSEAKFAQLTAVESTKLLYCCLNEIQKGREGGVGGHVPCTYRNLPTVFYCCDTGVCRIFAPCKAKSSNQTLLIDYCVRGHKVIVSHLICQIRNTLHFLDFAFLVQRFCNPQYL